MYLKENVKTSFGSTGDGRVEVSHSTLRRYGLVEMRTEIFRPNSWLLKGVLEGVLHDRPVQVIAVEVLSKQYRDVLKGVLSSFFFSHNTEHE